MRLNSNQTEGRLTATLGEWLQAGMAAGSKTKLPDGWQLPLMAAHMKRNTVEAEALARAEDSPA